MTISIAVRNLRKTYAGESSLLPDAFRSAGQAAKDKPVFVLDEISFDIKMGERVGIVGENGAGKSTLLRIITGLTQPTSGSVAVEGRVHAALTLGVGLREEMTGRQNLLFDAELQGVPAAAIQARVDAMVEFVELGNFIDRPVKTYSTGMKSRLSFTGLVFIEPEILLIDEALSAGDQWFQKKANAAIRDLCNRGKIVIIVSHSRAAIEEMCSRCLWLHSGKIRADGLPGAVTAAYSAYQRERDERQLAKEYSAKAEQPVSRGAAHIRGVVIVEKQSAVAKVLFNPQDTAVVSIDLQVEKALRSPRLRLWIERIDGLVMTEDRPAGLLAEGVYHGVYSIKAELAPVMLAPSMYLLFVELLDEGNLVSRRSTKFRVVADMPMVGGQPALYAPITVTATRNEPQGALIEGEWKDVVIMGVLNDSDE
jgi:lipopolysaccharide transport system ATP-binding protein